MRPGAIATKMLNPHERSREKQAGPRMNMIAQRYHASPWGTKRADESKGLEILRRGGSRIPIFQTDTDSVIMQSGQSNSQAAREMNRPEQLTARSHAVRGSFRISASRPKEKNGLAVPSGRSANPGSPLSFLSILVRLTQSER